MGTYLINFIVYTMAMVGLLFLGVMVYKKTMTGVDTAQNPKGLKIDNALRLSPRKTLYVVNAGCERFLIAADLDRTTFLARLDNNNTALENIATIDVEPAAGSFKESIKSFLKQPQNSVKKEQPPQEVSYIARDDEPAGKKINKGVDYNEVMQALEGDSTNIKRPVMRELLRKLNENVTAND